MKLSSLGLAVGVSALLFGGYQAMGQQASPPAVNYHLIKTISLPPAEGGRESFDYLYAEGARSPKMMSIGIHCRLAGRPSRAATLARFLDYVAQKSKVWVATREEIARHWMKVHPAPG